MSLLMKRYHIRLTDKAKWFIFGFVLIYMTIMIGCMVSLSAYAFDDKNKDHRVCNGEVTDGNGQNKDTEELSEGDLLPAGTSPGAKGVYPIQIDKGYEKGAYDNFRYIFGSEQVDDVKEVLNFRVKGNEVAIKTSIETIYNVLVNIGLALVVVFMLMDVIDKMTRDLIDGETLIRIFIKFIIIKFAMESGVEVLDAIFKVGASLTSSLGTIETAGDDFLWKLADWIQDSGMLFCYAIMFCSFIPYLIAWLLNIIIMATAYGRMITIIVRGGFAPIACASMVQDGFSGNGMRYIKKFFGSVIQGAVILAILVAGKFIMEQILLSIMGETDSLRSLGDFIGATLSCLVVLFTEVLLILKSEQTAMDIVGA